MLITPVQPHNSLNNIVLHNKASPADDQQCDTRKIQEIKTLPRIPTIRKIRKVSSGGNDESPSQKKQILAGILKDFEQISKDKEILTVEIKNMKVYLSEIRSKLDQSLTALNRNTKLFARKSGIAKSLLSPPTARSKKSGLRKQKSKAKKKDKSMSSMSERETFLNHNSFLSSSIVSPLKFN